MFNEISDTASCAIGNFSRDLKLIFAPLSTHGETFLEKAYHLGVDCLQRGARLLALLFSTTGLGIGLGLGALGIAVVALAAGPCLSVGALLTFLLRTTCDEFSIGSDDEPLDGEVLEEGLQKLNDGDMRCRQLSILNGGIEDTLPMKPLLAALRRCQPSTLSLRGYTVDDGVRQILANEAGYLLQKQDDTAPADASIFCKALKQRKISLAVRDGDHLIHKLDKLLASQPMLLNMLSIAPRDDLHLDITLDQDLHDKLTATLTALHVKKLVWKIPCSNPQDLYNLSWPSYRRLTLAQ